MMHKSKGKSHFFDTLFVTFLFFVFLLCALTVVAIGSSVYRASTTQMNELFYNKTATAYLSQKIRQNDVGGNITLVTFQNQEALQIRQVYNDNPYLTLIYVYQGQLMELFIREGVEASPEAGKAIMELQSLIMEQEEQNLLRFTITNERGNSDTFLVAKRSEG